MAETIDKIDFRNWSKLEIMAKLQEMNDPKVEPLIKWIASSIAFGDVSYKIRVAIAGAEQEVENGGYCLVKGIIN